jgi:hypothetical protein
MRITGTPQSANSWHKLEEQMSSRLWLISLLSLVGISGVTARGADLPGPSEFYIVSQFFTDNGALFYYRVIEVKADGPDSVIRCARIAPMNVSCAHLIVLATEARVRNMLPGQLTATNNPCTVKPARLHSMLRKYRWRAGVSDTTSFGIVARCGSSSVVLQLPIPEKVNLGRMGANHPEIARLWDLAPEMLYKAFGSKDVFHDLSDEDDLVLQRAGESLISELISGWYDDGLKAAVKGNVGNWHNPTFRTLLDGYRGPISAAVMNAVPQLLQAQQFRFSHFVAPKYPPLAMQARIEGKVELQLMIDPLPAECAARCPSQGIHY